MPVQNTQNPPVPVDPEEEARAARVAAWDETFQAANAVPDEDDPIQDVNIDWTAYAVSPANGKNTQVVFSPPPEQKLTGNRCWSALSLLDSLKKEGQRKTLAYSWEADCQGGGKSNVLTLDLTLTEQ